jgi:hypothetical protein
MLKNPEPWGWNYRWFHNYHVAVRMYDKFTSHPLEVDAVELVDTMCGSRKCMYLLLFRLQGGKFPTMAEAQQHAENTGLDRYHAKQTYPLALGGLQ